MGTRSLEAPSSRRADVSLNARATEFGALVALCRPRARDREAFKALRLRDRRHLERWEPIPRGVDAFTDAELDRAFDRELKLRRTATDERFLIWCVSSGELAGKISISAITRGPLQECRLGYWLGRAFTRRGYMTEAVGLATRHAFLTLGLHRVEANMQPHNEASRGVVQKNGFLQEGFSPRYLLIRGRWRDHERWAITREIWMETLGRRALRKPVGAKR